MQIFGVQLQKFTPRLWIALQSYSKAQLLGDIGAGLTVGIVALPLAMAFAIASGLTPQAGLWTAIVAGFLISALGGSNIQIGGPAGAFIVIVYGIVERYGLPNLLISTALAGALLFAMGLFKLGNLVRYVPVGIIIGFTNGIAVLVALSQLKDAFGLTVAKMPADFFSLLGALVKAAHSYNTHAIALTLLCVGGLALWPRLFKQDSRVMQVLGVPVTHGALKTASRIPGPIIALVTLTALAYVLQMPVETIGSKFGGITQDLPRWQWPSFSWETVKQLVSPTLTIAMLGAIESLLCARVGDQVAKGLRSNAQPIPTHDPNQELMAQGIANMIVPFIGGMPATGTIARTVTNVRAGANTPVAGMVHALALAAIVLLAAPLAAHIPLAILAGVLLFVAWNMGEWREFARLRHYSNHYRLVMLGTFLLTVVLDLTVALEVGMVLACALFVRRMGVLFEVTPVTGLALADETPAPASASFALRGVLFFGAVVKMDTLLQQINQTPTLREITLDCSQLLALDTSGADTLEQIVQVLALRGGHLTLQGLVAQPLSLLERTGLAQQVRLTAQAPK
jgi:sulfate permease, SulP family